MRKIELHKARRSVYVAVARNVCAVHIEAATCEPAPVPAMRQSGQGKRSAHGRERATLRKFVALRRGGDGGGEEPFQFPH